MVCSPGTIRAVHMANEHVPIAHLEAAARSLVVLGIRFCGAE